MLKKVFSIFLVSLFLLCACSPKKWYGFVIQSKYDPNTKVLNIGEFNSLEECREAALAALVQLNAAYSGTYVCGNDCKADPKEANKINCASSGR